MRIEIKKKLNHFVPVTIEITFESQNELAILYARLNVSFIEVEKSSKAGYPAVYNGDCKLFNTIDGLLNFNQ